MTKMYEEVKKKVFGCLVFCPSNINPSQHSDIESLVNFFQTNETLSVIHRTPMKTIDFATMEMVKNYALFTLA